MTTKAILSELDEWDGSRRRWEGQLLESQEAIARIDARREKLRAMLVERGVEQFPEKRGTPVKHGETG